jgi:hypothetical protein
LRKLNAEQPRVRSILKFLEGPAGVSGPDVTFLTQPQSLSQASGEPEDEEAFYESVTERARAILRREKIMYASPPNLIRRKDCQVQAPFTVTSDASTSVSTSTQVPSLDPTEEEEEILRSLFFLF